MYLITTNSGDKFLTSDPGATSVMTLPSGGVLTGAITVRQYRGDFGESPSVARQLWINTDRIESVLDVGDEYDEPKASVKDAFADLARQFGGSHAGPTAFRPLVDALLGAA